MFYAPVLAALGKTDLWYKTDLDNTDVVRDHSFHCIASAESGAHRLHYACGVNGFNIPESPTSPRPSHSLTHFVPPFQLPSGFRRPVDDRFSFIPVRKTQAGRRPVGKPGRLLLRQAVARQRLRGGRGEARENSAAGGRSPQSAPREAMRRQSLPAMELREVVGAHDPDKAHARRRGGARWMIVSTV